MRREYLPAERPRPELLPDKPYSPGLSIDEIKERFGLSRVIKLASNENPLGPSPAALRAMAETAGEAHRYPRPGNPRLRLALADHFGLPEENLVIGNGSDEIIDLLIRLKVRPGRDHVLACRPCFSVYGLQSRLAGAEFRQIDLNDDLSFPATAFADAADENTALAFVTSPDNPSGLSPSADELRRLAAGLPANCLLVVDEAYMDFAEPLQQYEILRCQPSLPNVAVMRTFSKFYGLAGLRLGFAAMPPELAKAFLNTRLPFSVNVMAEAAGLAALNDRKFLEKTLAVVRLGRDFLNLGLRGLGFQVWPSQANFVMAKPPDNGPKAEKIFEMLLKKGLIIRHLKSFGLHDHLRLSIGLPEENQAVLTGLAEIFNEK